MIDKIGFQENPAFARLGALDEPGPGLAAQDFRRHVQERGRLG
ncbi:MAG: hypothetical protein WD425_11140 [Nitrospirales bacterium]